MKLEDRSPSEPWFRRHWPALLGAAPMKFEDRSPSEPWFLRHWPALLGVALGALVCLRTVTAFTDQPWFDVDPVFDPNPYAGLGPAGSLRIDAAICVVSGLMLLAFAGRAAALLALGALSVVTLRLGSESALGALGWRGWDWIGAWMACAAAVAVARNPRQQARLAWSAMVATLLGVCALWMARGAWQWFHEHPSTVQYFRSDGHDAAFFREHGWDPQGPQALNYVRRLEQREMTGWFGLANIFAGVMAVAAVALAGVPRERGRDGMSWGVLSAACAAAVVANGSKGAIVAMAIGFAAVAALRWWRVRPGPLAIASVGVVLLSALAPWLRSVALAGAMPGERSLLFRWHYGQTAWRAWLERPWIGTGPDGFRDASARLRPADAVEIVQSAHAVFVDWVTQLGASGLAWVAAALAVLAWSARGAALEPTPLPAPPARDGTPQFIVLVAIALASVLSLSFELHALGDWSTTEPYLSLVLRLVGCAAWAGVAVTLLPRLWSARSCGAHLLFPAALVALCHAQVEMTLWNPGSTAWLLVALGAAVPPHALSPDSIEIGVPPRRLPRGLAAVAALVAGGACALGAASAQRIEHALETAAAQLVRQSAASSGVAPTQARRNAADALRPFSRLLASDQSLRAAALAGIGSPTGRADLASATADADEAVANGAGLVFASRLDALHAAALAWEVRALASQSRDDQAMALQRALAVTAFDTRAASAWLRAARMARALGRDDAATYAQCAVRADDSFGLDPLARLAPRDRAEAEALARLTSPAPAAAP